MTTYQKHIKNLAKIAKLHGPGYMPEKLQTVAFYGNRAVATDAIILAEFPADGEAHKPLAVPVKDFMANAGRDSFVLEERFGDVAYIQRAGVGNDIEASREYPDVDKVRPQGEPVASVRLDVKRLALLLDVLKSAGGDAVTVDFRGDTKPLVIRDDGRCYGMIMPIRRSTI